jgi:hypothetical protein
MSYQALGRLRLNATLMDELKNSKLDFCARGDRQKEGINYFETWAPVVQWSTV